MIASASPQPNREPGPRPLASDRDLLPDRELTVLAFDPHVLERALRENNPLLEGVQLVGSATDVAAKAKKKKHKARAAWISFVGRIIAQVIGALATVFLGIYAVDKFNEPRRQANPQSPARQETSIEPGAIQTAGGEPTIAVLPLNNFSADERQDYFADAMTEALITHLSQSTGLKVISRTSSMHYKDQHKTLRQIAQELGALLIVEGSVTVVGNRVRITAQLIDASRDEHLWARSYDSAAGDMLALHAEVASAVAHEVIDVVAASEASARFARR